MDQVLTPAASHAASIGARLNRLPATRSVWLLVVILSLGGWFEFYDLFFTAYVAPGLVRSGVLVQTTSTILGFSGIGAFVAATFAGLFLGTFALGSLADRYGRRAIFTLSLLWYSAATLVMAFQRTAYGLDLWRLIAGIGIGVEFVTIDTYLTELVPSSLRGRAFALNHTIQYTSVPALALLAYLLTPRHPFGLDGWRWVILFGSAGSVLVWFVRRGIPESPRWLARHGSLAEAERITSWLEAKAELESGAPLPAPLEWDGAVESTKKARFSDIWAPAYRSRTIMLMVFNLFQTIGYYGFASWVPTLLEARGVTVTHSLLYSFVIAIASPVGPLLAMPILDRIERKWVIVSAALGITVFGLAFSRSTPAALLILYGTIITLSNSILSAAYHAYQPELFPTRIRARAVGFVYSMSRLSAIFSGFLIAFCLRAGGARGVFLLIGGCMAVAACAVGLFGPRTRGADLEHLSQ